MTLPFADAVVNDQIIIFFHDDCCVLIFKKNARVHLIAPCDCNIVSGGLWTMVPADKVVSNTTLYLCLLKKHRCNENLAVRGRYRYIMVKLMGCGPGLWIVLLKISWAWSMSNNSSKTALIWVMLVVLVMNSSTSILVFCRICVSCIVSNRMYLAWVQKCGYGSILI